MSNREGRNKEESILAAGEDAKKAERIDLYFQARAQFDLGKALLEGMKTREEDPEKIEKFAADLAKLEAYLIEEAIALGYIDVQ